MNHTLKKFFCLIKPTKCTFVFWAYRRFCFSVWRKNIESISVRLDVFRFLRHNGRRPLNRPRSWNCDVLRNIAHRHRRCGATHRSRKRHVDVAGVVLGNGWKVFLDLELLMAFDVLVDLRLSRQKLEYRVQQSCVLFRRSVKRSVLLKNV